MGVIISRPQCSFPQGCEKQILYCVHWIFQAGTLRKYAHRWLLFVSEPLAISEADLKDLLAEI